jgi:hypothetical protein
MSSRRATGALLGVVALVGASVPLLGSTASGGAGSTIEIQKVVDGAPPSGSYTVDILCTSGMATPNPVSVEANGPPVAASISEVTYPTSCVIVETGTGAELAVFYDCSVTSGPVTCAPDGAGATFTGPGTASFVVTNSYSPPGGAEPAAEPIEAPVTFTG